MINIRKGVFETNSSSSHSMCIRNDTNESCIDVETVEKKLNVDGIWFVDGDKNWYERSPVRLLDKFSEKALYVLALVTYNFDEDKFNELTNIVKKYVPKFKGFDKIIKHKYSNDFGYVQNTGIWKWMKKNSISMEDLLTNSRYSIVVDGDEYNIFTGMEECGIISNNVNITTSWDG